MKRTLVGALLVGLCAIAVGSTADAADGPTLSQFRRLQRQVNQMEREMNRMEDRIHAIENAPGSDPCLSTIPVAQFNDYEQYFDSGPITALDIDNAHPDWQVVIRTC